MLRYSWRDISVPRSQISRRMSFDCAPVAMHIIRWEKRGLILSGKRDSAGDRLERREAKSEEAVESADVPGNQIEICLRTPRYLLANLSSMHCTNTLSIWSPFQSLSAII